MVTKVKIGDELQLNSGSPKMTVTNVEVVAGETYASVKWDSTKGVETEKFNIVMLKKYEARHDVIVPQALLDQIAEIETWFDKWLNSDQNTGNRFNVKIVAYSQYSEWGPDEWRFKIIDTETGNTIVDHLFPEKADGHTYMLLIGGMRSMQEVGIKQGKESALKAINKHLGAVVFA